MNHQLKRELIFSLSHLLIYFQIMYSYDSRTIQKGDVFLCLPGGEIHIQTALKNGASEVLSVTRSEMAKIAHSAYGNPSKTLTVIGVTGTNGKTTVTQLVNDVLNKVGFKSCVQGTITHQLTTPESLDTAKAMATHLQNGGTHYVMEVSSHGIHQDRIKEIHFKVKLLTNITQDHLDYHGTFEAYQAVKLSFMANTPETISIMPEDFQKIDLGFTPHLKGRFNLDNLKASKAILLALGMSQEEIITHLSTSPPPPGRFETLSLGQPYTVIVDFAHTPDALENILTEAKLMADHDGGKVISVFGCGGNRDTGKRPKMGAISEKWSHTTIITSDNPRDENPQDIIADILNGIQSKLNAIVIEDRKDAINHAISMAAPHDVIVIAGKGHEKTQISRGISLPFSDQDTASQAIKNQLKRA